MWVFKTWPTPSPPLLFLIFAQIHKKNKKKDLGVKVSCVKAAENDSKSTELMLLSDCGHAANDAYKRHAA